MNRARILLVDDDPSIRRFVALALEDLEIDLIVCPGVREAVAELRRAPVALLITDLMMPGESGLDLLLLLQDEPHLRAGARQVVFSAGLNAAIEAALAQFDIWRRLSKPISVLALEDCVQGALAGPGLASAAPVREASATPLQAANPSPGAAEVPLSANESAAVARHFAGEEALFRAFRASCLAQFVSDCLTGDAAERNGDAPALRLLAHSLKSVLATLGHESMSNDARQLEASAHAGDWATSRALWLRLRQSLETLGCEHKC
jgi:CheY-like chemotaxis protein